MAANRLELKARAEAPPLEDILEHARWTIIEIMRGRIVRDAWAKLQLAQTILSRDYVPNLTDEALIYEVNRRVAPRQCLACAARDPMSALSTATGK